MTIGAGQRLSSTRIIGVVLVVALHVALVYGLISGLAVRAVKQLPEELFAQVVSAPPPVPQPPPVAPSLVQPSVPTVAPPLIRIEQSQASDRSISVYVGTPTPARAEPTSNAQAWAPPVGIERTHTIPPYPFSARRLAQRGTVRLSLTVSPDGNVSDGSVIASSGSATLDDAALDWVKRHWRYRPAMKEGHAVAATVRADIIFDLRSA
jgi:protein TonB